MLTIASRGESAIITPSDSRSKSTLPLSRHSVEGREIHRLQMVVHGIAQLILHAERHFAAPIAADARADEDRHGLNDKTHQPGPQRRAVVKDGLVHDLSTDERNSDLAGAADYRRATGKYHVAPMVEPVAPQPAQPALLYRRLSSFRVATGPFARRSGNRS